MLISDAIKLHEVSNSRHYDRIAYTNIKPRKNSVQQIYIKNPQR